MRQPSAPVGSSRLHRAALLSALLCVTASTLALSGCGGGGGGGADEPVAGPPPPPSPPPPQPPPPAPPVGNQPPQAAFIAPVTLVAGQAAALDSRASTDPEGGPLVHAWDFGDGSRGGSAQIAHIYTQPGRYDITLTLQDNQGARTQLTRTVSVTAAPAATRSVRVAGLVTAVDGTPLAGARVSVEGTTTFATTNAQGGASLDLPVGVDVVLRVAQAGYADQIKALKLPASVASDGYFEAVLLPRGAAQTLADAAAGGTVVGSDGARLTVPAGALVTAANAPVSGAVQVSLTPVDINSAAVAAFPGRFEGLGADGSAAPIASYGSTEFSLSQGGQRLQLKAGARATLLLPLYATQRLDGSVLTAGGNLPLWSLDERSGQWVLEGQGQLVAAPASPTGLAMQAEVGHLSWWNADQTYPSFRPKPKCINDVPGQYDDLFAQAQICKMLAEMDRPLPAMGASSMRALAAPAGTGVPGVPRTAADAASAPPRFPLPAIRIEADVPIAGGVAVPMPAGANIVLVGMALNGTWRGRIVVRSDVAQTLDVNVPLRPVAAGGSNEVITLPFDAVRAAAIPRTDRYRFTAAAGQGVVLSVAQDSSTLAGAVRLRDASGALLASSRFGSADSSYPSTLRWQAATAGEYTLEVEALNNAPGAYRLQAALGTATARLPYSLISAPQALTSAPGAPVVAANTAGTAWAAYTTRSGSVGTVWASRYLGPTLGWSAGAAVSTSARLTDTTPLQIGVDGAGNTTLAWDEGSGPVVLRHDAASARWGTAEALASADCGGGLAQQLAVGAQGAVTLLWQRAGARPGFCTRRLAAAGGSWGPEQTIDTPVIAPSFAPGGMQPIGAQLALAAAPDGAAVALWVLNGTAFETGGLAAARLSPTTGLWSAPVLVSAAPGSSPAIALAPDGHALAVWRVLGAVQGAGWPSAGEPWQAPRRVGDSNSGGLPTVVHAGLSNFQVVWQTFSSGINAVVYDSSRAAWSAAQGVATNGLNALLRTASDGTGSVVVTWLVNATGGSALGLSRLDASGRWVEGTARLSPLVSTVIVTATFSPDTLGLAVAGGQISAVWRESLASGGPIGVQGARALATP